VLGPRGLPPANALPHPAANRHPPGAIARTHPFVPKVRADPAPPLPAEAQAVVILVRAAATMCAGVLGWSGYTAAPSGYAPRGA
jgi:hypothetical protein